MWSNTHIYIQSHSFYSIIYKQLISKILTKWSSNFKLEKIEFFLQIPIQIQNTDNFQLIPSKRSISVQNGDDLPDTISRIPPKQNTSSRRMHHIIAFPCLYFVRNRKKRNLVRWIIRVQRYIYNRDDNTSLNYK